MRHGPVDIPAKTCLGWADIPLSDAVKTAAAAVSLAKHIGEAEAIYASDLSRAVQTARPLAEFMKAPLILNSALREMDFGEWDMRLWPDLAREEKERFEGFFNDWQNVPPPGGESFHDMMQRVEQWWGGIKTKHKKTVVLVAHGGSLAALACIILGWSPPTAMQKMIERGKAACITGDEDSLRWNVDPQELLPDGRGNS